MARILLVEDEAVILMLASLALEDYGHEVVMAADGREGLAKARAEAIDVIITDFMMPEMDGIAMLTALRAEGNEAPAIVTTAIPQGQLPCRTNAPFDAYVPKPYNEDTLADSIARLLKRSPPA
ncbi:response regulator transcription factor [Jiella marina]|uniref:response regulator transcription factor n=1 Tax=Jiella sp. LLJ827 TaxID=2917712 RepID=UPI00210172C9|nr:response regulator [Jiella sp. LLJ827]MCQ0988321.1 response regulator [Jiella sp. LLJ827]